MFHFSLIEVLVPFLHELEFEEFLRFGGADPIAVAMLDHDEGNIVLPGLILLRAGKELGLDVDIVLEGKERVRVYAFALLLFAADDPIDDVLLFERQGVPKSLTIRAFAIVLGCRRE